jgi:uncharacterized protein involved in exopolysaccharide biosynthesis
MKWVGRFVWLSFVVGPNMALWLFAAGVLGAIAAAAFAGAR